MKNTPAAITTALVSAISEPYLILDMEFSSNNIVRLTSLPYDVSVGGNTYISDGGLTQFEPPKLTSVLDKETYRIKLTDHSNIYKGYFDSNALGTPVTVRLGIEGNTTDFDIIYKGRIDGVSIEVDPSESIKIAVIECGSPFAALERTNERRTDHNTQTLIDQYDISMSEVYANSTEIEVKWGKA